MGHRLQGAREHVFPKGDSVVYSAGVGRLFQLGPLEIRSQSPEESPTGEQMCRLVGDLAVPYELYPVVIEGLDW